jgi:Zn-dependent peptidase ImmA (M78 family)/DNA-binding XRE family transcriptional regulator
MDTFNGEIIAVARESRCLSQQELAVKLGTSTAQLSRIEAGVRVLKDKDIQEKLQTVLNYPRDFFLQRNLVYGIGVSEVFHRKRQSVSERTLRKYYAQIYLRTTELSKMLRNAESKTAGIRQVDINDFSGDASEIAFIIRGLWGLPRGPVRDLASSIENAGGIVIPFDFETNTIDAISHWPHDMPPLFFINKFAPADRVRFTLCHELAHIIMHRTVEFDSERQADEFAAEFLMPKADIRVDLADLSIQKLALLKQVWRVSMAALLKRAVDLEQITPRHARTLWMTMSKLGYRTHEPHEIDVPQEQPQALDKIVDKHLFDMKYSMAELSKMLCLSEAETRSIYIEHNEFAKHLPPKGTLKEDVRATVKDVEELLKQGNDGLN